MSEKILIAETRMTAANLLAEKLRQQGYQTLWSSDAIYTLNLARQAQPDAIVLSAQLAGGGALSVLKRVRMNVHTTSIPIVVLGGHGGANSRECLAAGAQAYLPAEADTAAIFTALRAHILQPLDFTQAPAESLAAPERLNALKKTGLLDSQPEPGYDKLTRLMSRLLGTPVALLSLVDSERQVFKSQVGLGQPLSATRQTRLSHSFCQWVVSSQEELAVSDARQHPVLKSNLAIQDMGVIAYAGVPVTVEGGHTIGSFCAIDMQPRDWHEHELATLRDLALVTEACIHLDSAAKRDASHGVTDYAGLQATGNAAAAIARIMARHSAQVSRNELDELHDHAARFGRRYLELLPA